MRLGGRVLHDALHFLGALGVLQVLDEEVGLRFQNLGIPFAQSVSVRQLSMCATHFEENLLKTSWATFLTVMSAMMAWMQSARRSFILACSL